MPSSQFHLTRKVVVDSNGLQSPKLRAYLAKSSRNFVVLSEYAAMEAYKGNTLSSIFRSMAILADYPNQVIILKGTQVVCGLRGRRAGLQRRLIDESQTQGFPEFCHHLRAAERGSVSLRADLLEKGRAADAQMDRMLADAASMASVFDAIAENFTAEELKIIRTDAQYTDGVIAKIMKGIIELSTYLFRDHPRVMDTPQKDEVPNRFIFRIAISAFFLALDWISVGGAKNVRPDRMRNDLVDISFAAFATYFDDLLTEDQKLTDIYLRTKFVLRAISTPEN
jgi:hypothetical protein